MMEGGRGGDGGGGGGPEASRAAPVPPGLVAFMRQNGVDLNRIMGEVKEAPRFIRIPTRVPATPELIKEIEGELNTKLHPTPLERIFKLKEDRGLSDRPCYKNGKIFGIDLASAFTVHAMELEPGMHVLDLCCAPGAKLCMIAELVDPLHNRSGNYGSRHGPRDDNPGPEAQAGSVVGVDIARQRLNTCRNLIRKYKVMGIRLYRSDGTRFDVKKNTAPIRHMRIIDLERLSKKGDKGSASTSSSESGTPCGANERKGPGGGKSTRKRSRGDAIPSDVSARGVHEAAPSSPSPSSPLYDRVLVDAECTHDGSVRHMLKYKQSGWRDFEAKVLVPDRLKNLESLQRRLVENGFRLLRPGGILVYSTCSFCRAQNEDIVQWLLENCADAALLPPTPLLRPAGGLTKASEEGGDADLRGMEAGRDIPNHQYRPVEGFLRNTLRFDPLVSHTSGLFLARITKQVGRDRNGADGTST